MIVGSIANDALSGENGDDFISGNAGKDLIRGHRGNDRLFGDEGDDVLLLKRIKKTCPAIPLERFCKIGVKLKFYDFQITTLEKSAVKCSQENFVKLLTQIWQRHQNRSVRLVGLYVSIPTIIEQKQMSLW